MKIHLCYQGGAGGQWLSHLIYLLESNKSAQRSRNNVNFHQNPQSKNIIYSHFPNHNKVDENLYKFYFNGKCSFNFYINNIVKFYDLDKSFNELNDFNKKLHILKYESLSSINYTNNQIDLCYEDLYYDNNKFIKDLYNILDTNSLEYFKNEIVCYNSIEYFKQTCINPENFYCNYDNTVWLGWCLGILIYQNGVEFKNKIFENEEHFKYEIKLYHNSFKNFTDERILFF